MAKIRVITVEPGTLPEPGPAVGRRDVDLIGVEIAALVNAGIWASPDDPNAWTVADGEGRVWAGASLAEGAQAAQVRGKNGHRLGGGRLPYAESEGRRERMSFALLPSVRRRLVELAEQRGKSMSMVLEDLILAAAVDAVPTP